MLKELLTEASKESYLDYFGLDKKKFQIQRILIAVFLTVVTLGVAIIFENNYVFVAVPILGFIGYKLKYYQLVNDKNYEELLKSFMFPQFLNYYIGLMGTQGNVYQTLKRTEEYLNEPLKSEVGKFIKKIEKDDDYKHYVDFAKYIGTSESHMVMTMLYNFNKKGAVDEEIKELERTIEELNHNKTEEMVNYKSEEQEKYMNSTIIASIVFVLGFVGIVLYYSIADLGTMMGGFGG